jgi:DNA polymerase III subunit gamma/tau
MYKAFYRKWRPRVFNDVIGQEHVTQVLKSEVASGQLSHAYLFCGTRGTGKTSCAKILAKAVNCLASKDGNPCLGCEICRGIESESILDVSEIDAASNNGVENVRAIREEAGFVASAAKFRVYIIDEFHMLSQGAFNALLKTLEEPPGGVIFILATTEFYKIPKTVVSRCQRFDFRRISVFDICSKLQFIANEEKINICDDALSLIAKISDGSLRDAISIFDQCARGIQNVDAERVRSVAGLAGSRSTEQLAAGIAAGDLSLSLDYIDEMYKNGKDMTRLCEDMLGFFHDIFVFKASGRISENCIYDADSVKDTAGFFSLKDSLSCFDIFKKCCIQMSKSPDKKTEIEFAVISACQIKNINNPSENIPFKNTNNSVKNILQDFENGKQEKIEHDLRKDNHANFPDWNDILSELEKTVPKYVLTILKSAQVHAENTVFFVKVSGDFACNALKKSDCCRSIQEIILKFTGKNFKTVLQTSEENHQNLNLFDKFINEAEKIGIKTIIPAENNFP